jgi:hypothetical protein
LAYCDCSISTGPLEDANDNIRSVKRQALDLRDREFFILKVMEIRLGTCSLAGDNSGLEIMPY